MGLSFASLDSVVLHLSPMRFPRALFLLICLVLSPLQSEGRGGACGSYLSTLSFDHLTMQAWLRKRLSHFSSQHQFSQSTLSAKLADSLKHLWFDRLKQREVEVSRYVSELGLSRAEAHQRWNLETDEQSYDLFLSSFGNEAVETYQKRREEEIRSTPSFQEARRDSQAVEATVVDVSRLDKAIVRYQIHKSYLDDFVSTLTEEGPHSRSITGLTNHQKTGRKYGNGKRGWTHFHCHLKRGHPTMVVGYWVNDKNPREVEIDYWGTHEGVPWGNH